MHGTSEAEDKELSQALKEALEATIALVSKSPLVTPDHFNVQYSRVSLTRIPDNLVIRYTDDFYPEFQTHSG